MHEEHKKTPTKEIPIAVEGEDLKVSLLQNDGNNAKYQLEDSVNIEKRD